MALSNGFDLLASLQAELENMKPIKLDSGSECTMVISSDHSGHAGFEVMTGSADNCIRHVEHIRMWQNSENRDPGCQHHPIIFAVVLSNADGTVMMMMWRQINGHLYEVTTRAV